MPEEYEERGYGAADGFDEPDDFDDRDDLDDLEDDLDDLDDDLDDLDDEGEPGWPGHAWPAPGYPPGAPGAPPGGWYRAARRGWLLALTAVVAAAFGFGVVVVALHEAAGPASAGAAPSSSATPSPGAVAPKTGAGNGTQPVPQGGGLPPLPPGAMERLEIGGQVTAVSATSITLNGGGQEITATVTRATKVTGKVTSISGVKVGDFVSASISGANGKLTADSIQDPASLPSGSGQ